MTDRPDRDRISTISLTLAVGLTLFAITPDAAAEPSFEPEQIALEALKLSALVTKARVQGAQCPLKASCEPHCVILDSLRLSGSVETGQLRFELEGVHLGDRQRPIKLFGPASEVLVTLDGDRQARPHVFVQDNTYSVLVRPGNIALHGELRLLRDRALRIPGPITRVEASLDDGGLVEGDLLTGLTGTTVHLRRQRERAGQAEELALFEIARALSVGRQIRFEYRLGLSSTAGLDVLRLPLQLGEQVTEVEGAAQWSVEGEDLLLAIEGRSADITVRGTLDHVGAIRPDERSSSELWLLESEADRDLDVTGSGERLDVSQSPIPATLPNARLYLVERGQELSVSVETLDAVKVLSAVVRRHHRHLVISRQGDLVTSDFIEYENKGLAYLPYHLQGEPLYLATDREAERILRQDTGNRPVMIPLRPGRHDLEIQTTRRVELGRFGGALRLKAQTYPITAGVQEITLGLPPNVVPLAFFGGERTEWLLAKEDLLVAVVALLLGLLALRRRRGWPLASIGLVGLWFVSPYLFFCLLLVGLGGAIFVVLRGLLSGRRLVAAGVGLVVVGYLALWGISIRAQTPYAALDHAAPEQRANYLYAARSGFFGRVAESSLGSESSRLEYHSPELAGGRPRQIDRAAPEKGSGSGPGARLASSKGLIEGVVPVPLPSLSYCREVHATRQLVTEDQPFEPTLLYVTWWTIAPLWLLWLLALAGLAWLNRSALVTLIRHCRAVVPSSKAHRHPANKPHD